MAVNRMRSAGFEPDIITTPIKSWVEMQEWVEKAHVEYSTLTPTPRLNSTLVLEKTRLKIIHPLGKFPKYTMLINSKAVTWETRKNTPYGVLYIVFGNHQLYPLRNVELLAGTVVRCDVAPEGALVLGPADF